MEKVLFSMLIFAFLQGEGASVNIDVTPNGTLAVRAGEPFVFMCETGKIIKSCKITYPPEFTEENIRPGIDTTNKTYNIISNLQEGRCGLSLKSVEENNEGIFTCSVGVADEGLTSTANATLIVTGDPGAQMGSHNIIAIILGLLIAILALVLIGIGSYLFYRKNSQFALLV